MKLRNASTLVLTALACAVAAHAQTSQTTGAIRGLVRAKNVGPVAGATITARNLETGFVRTARSDGKGTFVMSLLPVGSYEVTVTAQGLKTVKNPSLRISLGESVAQNFDLDSAETSAMVEVVSESSQVDTSSVNTNTTFSQEIAESVPLNSRNFTDLVQLTPGAPPNTQGYRTAMEGARGIMNNLMIDGVSFNSKFNGEQRGGTRIPFAFGLDSIKELQVITNPFDVQYGDASGGIINAITKTGTNEFAGTLFTQIRPNGLVSNMKPVPYDLTGATNNPTALTRKFSRSEYGFNLGGPILKDKLHFFVNVDYVHFSQDSRPTVSFQATDGTQVSFNTFWGPGGMGQAVRASNGGLSLLQESQTAWTNDEKHLTVMGRVDWTINENHRAALRLNVQDYKGQNDIYAGSIKSNIAESNNSRINYQTLSWVASLNSVLSSNLVNDAYLQFSTERRPETPNTSISPEIGLPGFTAGNYYIDPRDTDETTTQIVDNLTFMTGDWVFKGGIDWQFLNYRNTFFQYGRGAWYFKNWDAANQWFSGTMTNPSTIQYQQSWSNTNGFVKFGEKLLATYLSAEYNGLLDKRLTLTLGIRYIREMYDANPNPNPRMQGLDQMPDNGSKDPRFGFAYDLFGNKRTVLRGGFGYFSVSNPAQNVASSFLQNGQNTLPYKVAWSAANNALFSTGGALAYSSLVNANGNLQILDPNSLASTLPSGTVQVTLMDPRAKMAHSRNVLLGVEHDLGDGLVLKARGVYKHFTHLQYFVDINMAQSNPATGSYDPNLFYNDGYPFLYNHFNNASGSVTRPGRAIVDGRMLDLSGYGSVGLSRFDGTGTYRALVLEAERRATDGFGFMGSLTFSSSRDSNSNERSTAQAAASNPYDPTNPTQESRADNDIPFRAIFISYFPPFFGVHASATFVYASGYPYTPRYYADQNADGYLNDPIWSGRNSGRQPNSKRLDLQFKRGWNMQRGWKLEGAIQIYNPFNWANQTTGNTTYDTSGVAGVQSASYGQINTPDKSTREVQLSLKAKF